MERAFPMILQLLTHRPRFRRNVPHPDRLPPLRPAPPRFRSDHPGPNHPDVPNRVPVYKQTQDL